MLIGYNVFNLIRKDTIMGQITQILVVKTIHFKDGTKQHKNELYESHWGHGRTMFMTLMSALWKHSQPVISDYLKDMTKDYDSTHPFSYRTIDHPSVYDEALDDGMVDTELSEEQIDNFLLQLWNHSGYMIFYYDTYETDDLYANRKYRLTMKQQTEQNDKLVKLSPVEYMNQYSNCTPDFIEAWKAFAQYWQIKTE